MSELRWTLLILGVVFIAALSWWERRRPRQAFAPRLRDANVPHADPSRGDAQRTASADPGVGGEPWIGEAGLADVVSADLSLTDAHTHDSLGQAGAHAHAEPSGIRPLQELPTLIIPDENERLAMKAAWDQQAPEPTLIDPEAAAAAEESEPAEAIGSAQSLEPIQATEPPQPTESSESIEAQKRPPAIAASPRETPARPEAPAAPATSAEPVTSAAPVATNNPEPEIFGAEGVGAVRIVPDPYGGAGGPPEPIVDWPPDESRRILALRLVAPQPERFPGRALRLALAAEGFLLGRFSIFHKPDESNRAVLSAASLTKPGAFDLETMDSQRYGGLSLFAVLPGPKAPQQAFEDLLATARNLNERLEGALQDERGGPLTPLRVAALRDGLRAEAASLKAAAAQ